MQDNRRDRTIVICEDCKGIGSKQREVWYGEYETEQCTTCCGTGRLVKVEEVRYEKM